MHRGSVTAESAGLGLGSEFIVRLPIAELPRAALDNASPFIIEHAAAGSRVLVIDDNKDMADSIVALLRLAEYEARAAYSGTSGLEMALGDRPRIALIDIGLPEMDGFELARRIRQHPTLKATLLVALTGYGEEHHRRASREAGFDHHLVKPVNPKTLLESLAEWISPSRAASA